MRNGEAIKCPICGKVLGHYVLDNVLSSPLGSIPCYNMKLDHRKASHHYSNKRGQKGHLCRSCAKKEFPEGKRYKVMVMHAGRPIPICGEDGSFFTTRQKADDKCKDITARQGHRYWVEEMPL